MVGHVFGVCPTYGVLVNTALGSIPWRQRSSGFYTLETAQRWVLDLTRGNAGITIAIPISNRPWDLKGVCSLR